MSWKSIVSGTMFDAPTVAATRVEALVRDRHDRDVRLDRRERVVRRLGARAGQRVEQRGLARVGHPDDADLHRPALPHDRAEQRARARCRSGSARRGRRRDSGHRRRRARTAAPAGQRAREYARAAANDDEACALGKLSAVGVAMSAGRSSNAGRRAPEDALDRGVEQVRARRRRRARGASAARRGAVERDAGQRRARATRAACSPRRENARRSARARAGRAAERMRR